MNKIASFVDYKHLYQQSVENPDFFWDNIASSFLWKQKLPINCEKKTKDAKQKKMHLVGHCRSTAGPDC